MFLNCDEFVEISLDLLATCLFNDLSKTFTNVLQITKFCTNHKKIPQRQSWANWGLHADLLFRLSPIFTGKIVDLRTCRLYFCSSTLCGSDMDPHFPKRGDCVRKVEYHWSRLCGKNLFLCHGIKVNL